MTAGTFYEDEILKMELIILKVKLLNMRMCYSLVFINNKYEGFYFGIILVYSYFIGVALEPLS